MKQFFSEVRTQLLNNVNGISTVELWNSQVESSLAAEGENPIVTPAVYMAIPEEIEYSDYTSEGLQKGMFLFTVYIVTENLVDNFFDDAGTDWKFMDFKESVYKALAGFLPTVSEQELIRKTELLNQDHGGYYVFTQSYSADFVDASAVPPTVEVDNVDLDLKTDLIISNFVIRTARNVNDTPPEPEPTEGTTLDFELDSELA